MSAVYAVGSRASWTRVSCDNVGYSDIGRPFVTLFFSATISERKGQNPFLLFFFQFYLFIFLLYNVVLVLPYIDMNLPWCTRVPHPEPPSHLPPHPIPLGHPSAPAPSTLYHASNLDWRFILRMLIYMFQCHSPKSSPHLPQSPKDCSIHLCLLCCLAYRVVITIFLNSIYMR